MCSYYRINIDAISVIFTEFNFAFNTTISITTTIILIHMIIAFDMFISFQGEFFVYSIEYRGELE